MMEDYYYVAQQSISNSTFQSCQLMVKCWLTNGELSEIFKGNRHNCFSADLNSIIFNEYSVYFIFPDPLRFSYKQHIWQVHLVTGISEEKHIRSDLFVWAEHPRIRKVWTSRNCADTVAVTCVFIHHDHGRHSHGSLMAESPMLVQTFLSSSLWIIG